MPPTTATDVRRSLDGTIRWHDGPHAFVARPVLPDGYVVRHDCACGPFNDPIQITAGELANIIGAIPAEEV